MIYMGLDPGLESTGYGVIKTTDNGLEYVASGAIGTKASMPMSLRLWEISNSTHHIATEYRPVAVAIERLFITKRNKSKAVEVAQGRGACMAVFEGYLIKVYEPTPNEIKAAVAHGKADKREVAEGVRTILGLDILPMPHHAADALAMAIWAEAQHRREMIVEGESNDTRSANR